MKKLFVILIAIFAFVVIDYVAAFADPEAYTESKKPQSFCPETLMSTSCLTCHTSPSFKLREAPLDEGYYLPGRAKLVYSKSLDKLITKYVIQSIDSDLMRTFFDYVAWHPNMDYLVFEIDSWGGSMFDSKTIIGYMDEFKADGGTIETVVKGRAASAAFMIFLNGTKGKRRISPSAHLMWHELWQFKMWAVDTPSSLEDEAKVLRFFMDVQNEWIASRCKLTKKQLDELVHKKELWCDGREAVEKYGFADKLIQ